MSIKKGENNLDVCPVPIPRLGPSQQNRPNGLQTAADSKSVSILDILDPHFKNFKTIGTRTSFLFYFKQQKQIHSN